MTHKKIITLLLCFVLCFTFVSAPFRADAASIAIPATVLGIVGLFVVSAGFTFDTVGDFRTAVTDFCNKNFNMTNGASLMNTLRLIAPNAASMIDIGSVIQNELFPDFWQSIIDFFGGGEVEIEIENAIPDGFASYNGYVLPTALNNNKKYSHESTHPYRLVYRDEGTGTYHLTYSYIQLQFYSHYEGYDVYRVPTSGSVYYSAYHFDYNLGDASWTFNNRNTGVLQTIFYLDGSNEISMSNSGVRSKLLWSSYDIPGIFEGSDISYGDVAIETIPVSVDSTYNPDLVYNGWMSRVEAEPWMTYDATSAVFQDITTAETDKTAPMTVTQTGVLSQGGVKVETDTDVVIPEYNGEYAVNGLTSIFPFCIPFDLYDFFSVLVAEREAPKFDFNLNFGKLGQYPLSVDLTGWDTAATILRTIELLAFCVGLALATSKLIKW